MCVVVNVCVSVCVCVCVRSCVMRACVCVCVSVDIARRHTTHRGLAKFGSSSILDLPSLDLFTLGRKAELTHVVIVWLPL